MNTTLTKPPSAPPGKRAALPLSVIIPTRNPRLDVIKLALDALRAQTLPLDQWELIIVDNDSETPLETLLDLSWHPQARFVVEKNRGMLPCRSRGMRESRGEVVVSVDDDNLLAPDYLATAIKLGEEQPMLGVWGGHIRPDYEGTPPAWIPQFAHHLAICEFDRPSWSSFVDDRCIPYGASMCVRRPVIDGFLERLATENIWRYGRTYGTAAESKISGVGGEDQLISYTAVMMGYAIGRFPELQMRHRVSSKRYEPAYFLKMVRGNAHGALLVQLYHGNCPRYRTNLIWPLLKLVHAGLRQHGMKRRVLVAEARGEIDGVLEFRRNPAVVPVHVPAMDHSYKKAVTAPSLIPTREVS